MIPAALPLVPFPTPAGVEPEFQVPPPRPIPEAFRDGRHAKKAATGHWFCVLFAMACAVLWVLTAHTRLRYYFLVIPYLPLVSVGTMVLGIVVFVVNRFRAGAHAYVRDGIVVRARVLDVQLAVAMTHNGVPSLYRYHCAVEYVDPHDGQRKQRVVASPDVEARLKEKTVTPLRIGQEVTAVGLPGRFDKTFTLYGFLQLSPDVDFLQRRDQDVRTVVPARHALMILAATGAITLLLGSVAIGPSLLPWSFPERAEPVPWAVLAVVTFVLGSVALTSWWRREESKKRAALEARNEDARREGRPTEVFAPTVTGIFRPIVFVAGGILPLLGGVLIVTALNAALDRSPARFETVPIKELRTSTTLLVFRSYEVHYERGGKTDSHALPVEVVAALQELSPQQGALEWHDGWLGLPWVRAIRPVLPEDGRAR